MKRRRINEVQKLLVGGKGDGGGSDGGALSRGGPHDSGRFTRCLNPYNLWPSFSTSNISKPSLYFVVYISFFLLAFGSFICFFFSFNFLPTKKIEIKISICYGPLFN